MAAIQESHSALTIEFTDKGPKRNVKPWIVDQHLRGRAWMDWNGMELNEWNGMGWNGKEWNRIEWNGVKWIGMK